MIMISPISYRPFNNKNIVSFKSNNSVIHEAVQVSRMLDSNGYEKTEPAYYNFLQSEIKELRTAKKNNDYKNMHEEIGDVLFDTIMLADYYGVNPAKALSDTNKKITSRIKKAREIAGRPLTDFTFDQRLLFWDIAKQELKNKQA